MATVYLAPAPTGDDTRTYAQAQNIATPWATPGKVNASAVNGDTVQMTAGTYTFSSITFSTNAFTWIGASPSGGHPTTILDGANADAQWLFTIFGSITNSFTNILFQNINRVTASPIFYWTINGAFNYSFVFSSCEFRTIVIPDGANLYAGLIGFSASGFGAPLTLSFTNCLFDNVTAQATGTNSAIINLRSPYGGTVTITGCTFSFRTGGATSIYAIVIANNGLFIVDVTLKNTIIANSSGNTINEQAGTPSTHTATYCDFFQITGSPSGTGVITSDPLLIDAVNRNFKLRPTSPCLGTGTLA